MGYSSMAKKIKNRNPRADPDHHQKSTTSSPLACACQVWLTSVSAFVSYPVYRMTENDRITSALFTEVIIIIIMVIIIVIIICYRPSDRVKIDRQDIFN